LQADPGNLLTFTVPEPVKNLRIKVTMMESSDGEKWNPVPDMVFVATVPAGERRRFYRGDIAFEEAGE
jgi:hypothetical protein